MRAGRAWQQQKIGTRPWGSMYSVARFDPISKSNYNSLSAKLMEGIWLNRRARRSRCALQITKCPLLRRCAIQFSYSNVDSPSTLPTPVHTHTHGDYSHSLRSQTRTPRRSRRATPSSFDVLVRTSKLEPRSTNLAVTTWEV
jgi:hypothetical protein